MPGRHASVSRQRGQVDYYFQSTDGTSAYQFGTEGVTNSVPSPPATANTQTYIDYSPNRRIRREKFGILITFVPEGCLCLGGPPEWLQIHPQV